MRPRFGQSDRPEFPGEHHDVRRPPLSEIDRRIVEAHRELGAARSTFAHSPSGAAVGACQTAEARLNELLDARLDRMTAARRARAA